MYLCNNSILACSKDGLNLQRVYIFNKLFIYTFFETGDSIYTIYFKISIRDVRLLCWTDYITVTSCKGCFWKDTAFPGRTQDILVIVFILSRNTTLWPVCCNKGGVAHRNKRIACVIKHLLLK